MIGFGDRLRRPRPRTDGTVNYAVGVNRDIEKPGTPERIVPTKLGNGRGEAARRLLSKKQR